MLFRSTTHLVCGIAAAAATLSWIAPATAVVAAGAAGGDAEVTREEKTIVVSGVRERWRLVWLSSPSPACMPDDNESGWSTCPCDGFAFGERGDLHLLRRVPGHADERLPLAPLFDIEAASTTSEAILARWPERDGDLQAADREGPSAFAARVRRRPDVPVMEVQDYDRDGQAAEFFLQVVAAPCGKRMGVVVGVSRRNPRLHAFSSAAHPERPLILRVDHWLALARSRGPITRVDWRCGDHATSEQEELDLGAEAGSIHVTRRFYACAGNDTRGPLLRSEEE